MLFCRRYGAGFEPIASTAVGMVGSSRGVKTVSPRKVFHEMDKQELMEMAVVLAFVKM